MPEKLPEEIRDAVCIYYNHIAKSYRGIKRREDDISRIESGKASREEALEIIKDVYGAGSFQELIDRTKGMPPLLGLVTEKDRNAVRALRYYTGQTAKMLGLTSEISVIENGGNITPESFLKTIKKAWGFESREELHKAARKLKQPLGQLTPEIREAIDKYLYHTDQDPETRLKGQIRTFIKRLTHTGSGISSERALNAIKDVWGFRSFSGLLEKTEFMQDPPKMGISDASQSLYR